MQHQKITTKKYTMKNNEDLQRDVQDAIKYEPLLHAAEIGVTVEDGVVTLSGTVDSYAKKAEAEYAAKNVSGVKAVVEKIEIHLGTVGKRQDADIAKEIVSIYKWNWYIPNETIKVKVEDGWVTLEGDLDWNYQRDAATESVSQLTGVRGITNQLNIKSAKTDAIEKIEIEKAINRNWSLHDNDIKVAVTGNRVRLDGLVRSLFQKDLAGKIAYNAPGVTGLDNELVIGGYDD